MSVISLQEWRRKQEKTSTSKKSQSKQNLKLEQTGLTPINFTPDFDLPDPVIETLRNIYKTLHHTHRQPYLTKSRVARANANLIALCASEGWISTKVNEEIWGNKWCITEFGIQVMNDLEVYENGD